MSYRYSPEPMEAYRLQNLPVCEVEVIKSSEYTFEAWNLFWLSNPTIDVVPTLGARWWEHYRPVEGLLVAVMSDVAEDEQLFTKLSLHPDVFSHWFAREDHTIFECYEKLGGRHWVSTVLDRAEEAARHLMEAGNAPVFDITQLLRRGAT